jgi:hypothetical protein
VKVTIVPFCEESSQVTSGSSTEDVHSGGSDSTLTLTDNCSFANNAFDQQNRNAISSRIIGSESRNFSNHSNCVSSPTAHRIEEEEEELNEENERVLALCLWKDRLYEDWGFSLVDESEVDDDNGENGNDETNESEHKVTGEVMKNDRARTRKGAIVFQIRPGGPAFVAGLRPGDRILQVNPTFPRLILVHDFVEWKASCMLMRVPVLSEFTSLETYSHSQFDFLLFR